MPPQSACASRTAARRVRRAADRDRRRPGAPGDSGHGRLAGALPAHASPTAGPSSPRPGPPSASSSSVRASSASKSPRRCARAGSTCMSSRPRASRSSASWARSRRLHPIGCTRRTASMFHLGATVSRIDGRVVTLSDGQSVDADLIVAGRRRATVDRAGRAGRPRRSTAASRSTSISRPARPASSPRATSRGGPIRIPATGFASSTGWSPNARARWPRRTCSASASASTRCRSSGASTTT